MDDEGERSDEEAEEVAEMQERAPRNQWKDQTVKDRLIGKMLRSVSQFVILQPVDSSNNDGDLVDENKLRYVRGNRAVIHTNDFLK